MSDADNFDVQAARRRIREITGRVVVSTNPSYLKRRLADLEREARPSAGAAADEGAPPISISMSRGARDAMDALAEAAEVGRSELVRRALALYARRHHRPELAQTIEGG